MSAELFARQGIVKYANPNPCVLPRAVETKLSGWDAEESGLRRTVTREIKIFPFALKAADDEAGIIEGYAAVFRDTPDSYGDIIKPGAFTKTLQERAGKIKLLYGHDITQIIGKPIEMREDGHGLFVRSQLFLDEDIPEGRKAYKLAKLGALSEMSIGYSTVKSIRREDDEQGSGRDLLEVKLFEYSLVPFAADDQAVVTTVKSEPDDVLAQQLEAYAVALLETKEGRVLSKSNLTRLCSAIESLQSVLAAAEPEPPKADTTQALPSRSQLFAEYQRILARLNGVAV